MRIAVNENSPRHRAGFVALAGRSNVGKSTLLNRLVGEKIAAVSPKPQTTRRRILGIVNRPDAQIILIDTPGLHEPKRLLNQRMVAAARSALADADVVLTVIEAAPVFSGSDRDVLREVEHSSKPLIIAINKIDRVSRDRLIAIADECGKLVPAAEIVPVSALKGENVEELLATISRMLPEGPSLMPDDQFTDQSERTLVAEIVREKLFAEMREEIPFSTAVVVDNFELETERSLLRISANIIVERESHKGMVIGSGGLQLKKIGQAARLELEQMLGSHIFLQLNVKVEKNWTRDPRKLEEFGL
jgi:GTP-binding protein Era